MALRVQPALPLLAAGFALLAAVCGLAAGVDPRYALVLAFGLAFVVVSLMSLAAGLTLFVLTGSLEVLPGVAEQLSFSRLAGGVLVLAWLASRATGQRDQRRFSEERGWLTAIVLLYIAWSGMSAVWAEEPAISIDVTTRLALNLMLLPIVYSAIRTRRHALWVVAAFALSALLSAAYGAFVSAGDLDAAAEGRVSGANLDPNYLATTIVASFALMGGVALGWRENARVRVLAAVAAVLCLVVLLFTVSRTGLVGLLAVVAAGVAFAGPRRRAAVAAVGVASLAAVVLYFAALAPDAAAERLTAMDGGTGRTDIWQVGWRMVEAEPVRGVGAGNFRISSVQYVLQPGQLEGTEFIVDNPKVAHNIYLDTLAELGVIGLVGFVIILGSCVVSALLAARGFRRAGDRSMEFIARGVAVASVATLSCAFFNSQQYENTVWLVLALGPVLWALSRSARHPTGAPAG